ncbi:DUF402 domain-containing protein, partial [Streptomyces sp. NPDC059467]
GTPLYQSPDGHPPGGYRYVVAPPAPPAAASVVELVERGAGWWEEWRGWRAPEGWEVPGAVPLGA